jgi:hypothetical protein
MNFDTDVLVALLGELHNSVQINYVIGPGIGKVSNLERTDPAVIHGLDCSGFVQYVIYKATTTKIRIPQGSVNQKDWLLARYREADYVTEAPRNDNCVRIAFRNTVPEKPATKTRSKIKKKVGHVWLVINGKTYESTKKNGNNGPAILRWSERTSEADHFFFLGAAPGFFAKPWPKCT